MSEELNIEVGEPIPNTFDYSLTPADFFNNVLKSATGFFGIMVIRSLGGNWAQSNVGMTIIHNVTSAFVMNRIGRFLHNGTDDLESFYNYLKQA